jgi:heat-inducible transcriptional repressor
MDARKAKVLSAVVDDYITSGEPVGSRTLARRYGFGLSPATLRNELADLEDLGYLDKPHTSAGRVPSDKGYRYYVDQLLVPRPLSPEDVATIRRAYASRVQEVEWFLRQTARLVSAATHYPAVVMAPPLSAARLTRLSLVPVGSGAALMVVETDDGLLEHRIVDLPPGLDPRTLVRIAGAISEELQGAPLADIASRRLTQLERRLGRHAAFLEELLALFEPSAGPGEQIALEGVPELLEYQEFRDAERIRQVWALLQEDRVMNGLLLSTLREPRDGAVTVRIGAEVPVQELHDMAVVAVNWRLGRDAVGRLAVIGPRRMNYGRVLTVLEYVSAELRRALAAP